MFLGVQLTHWLIAGLLTAVCALLLRWALHVDEHPKECDEDRARTRERLAQLEQAVRDLACNRAIRLDE